MEMTPWELRRRDETAPRPNITYCPLLSEILGGHHQSSLLDKCKLSFYNLLVITGFRHRGLRRLYKKDDPSRVPAQDLSRIRLILAALDAAQSPKDLEIHTFRL